MSALQDISVTAGLAGLTRIGLACEFRDAREWLEYGHKLEYVEGCISWWIGDWLCYGEAKGWGEKYLAASSATGLSEGTLCTAKWVCSNVEFSVRNEKLSFAHHHVIASQPKPKQAEWLGRAEREGWTVSQLRAALRQANGEVHAPAQGVMFSPAKMVLEFTRWLKPQPLDKMPNDQLFALYEEVQPVAKAWTAIGAEMQRRGLM